MHLIQPLTYPFYPPYVSTLSPQPLNLFYKPVVRESYCIFAVSICVTVFSASILHWIAAEKVYKPVKKGFSHQDFGKSREKRDFYIVLPKKTFTIMPYFASLWIFSGSSSHRIVYVLYTL